VLPDPHQLQCLEGCGWLAHQFLFQRAGAGALSVELGRPSLHSRVHCWLLSPLLVTQWAAGLIKAQCLLEPSLLSLIIQQVLKCLVSVSGVPRSQPCQ